MTDELVLYTNPMSRGRMARWMLEEVGAPYRAEILEYGPPMKAALQGLNAMGKVPVLRHGETVVSEAAAVCLYLADAFPDAGLAPPPGSPERGAYYRWVLFAAGPLEQAVTNQSLGVAPTAQQSGFVGYGNLDTTLAALEARLGAVEYVAGGGFSAADVYVGSAVGFGMRFGTIERRPAFEAYWSRLSERPAYKRAVAIDDALLAQQKSGG